MVARVVNCSQIFCTFAVETTLTDYGLRVLSCELLSNFLYFCSRNNVDIVFSSISRVVNCSQIFCTFAVETTRLSRGGERQRLWIALKFFVLLQSKQQHAFHIHVRQVVNCSQIFCTFAVETTRKRLLSLVVMLWIALKFFVLLQSKQRQGLTQC